MGVVKSADGSWLVMAKITPPTNRELDEAPKSVAQTAPGTGYGFDSSFQLQMMMQIQASIGELKGSVEGLKVTTNARLDKIDNKIDALEEKISGLTHKAYAAGVVLLLLLAVGGFILNKGWDLLIQNVSITTTVKK